MSVKNVIKVVKGQESKHAYDSADITNMAGGKAWSSPMDARIRQLMFTGTMTSTFYASQEMIVEEAIAAITQMAKENSSFLADMIVAGRKEGYIRTAPILGLAILSLHDITRFQNIFNDVIKTGNDMEDFIGFIKAIPRGFGRGIKTAMHKWLEANVSSYYAIKYSRQIGDAIRISRPVTKDPIYDYIMRNQKSEENYLEYLKKHNHKDTYKKALLKYPQLNAHEKAKVAIEKGEWKEASKLIEEASLDPMSLIGLRNPPQDVWKALAKQMGVMMYLKYINKLTEENALEDSTLAEKLTVSNLKKASVFPFRFYTAYRNVSSEKAKDHIASLMDEYVTSYDWGKWNKKIVIAPDVSGSMTTKIGKNSIVPANIAGMFSGILYKGVKGSKVIPWDTQVYPKRMGPRQDSVLTHIERIADAKGGGTYMEAPILHMIKDKIVCDLFIAITDSMEWGSGWLSEWIKYRKDVGKKSKAVLIRVDSYNSHPFDPKTAEQYGIYQVFGWNDNVLKFIEDVVLI